MTQYNDPRTADPETPEVIKFGARPAFENVYRLKKRR